MKKTGLLLLIGILMISCNQKEKQKTAAEPTTKIETTGDFDWLLGNWKRLGEEEGNETFENWNAISKTEYSGIGYTMQNGDTIKQEKIQLIKTNGKWNLTVKAPEDTKSITFNVTSFNENEFICENHELDFPNKIKYWKNGNQLNASVSNSEMEIPFEFKKLN